MYSRCSDAVPFSEPPLKARFRELADRPCVRGPRSWPRSAEADQPPARRHRCSSFKLPHPDSYFWCDGTAEGQRSSSGAGFVAGFSGGRDLLGQSGRMTDSRRAAASLDRRDGAHPGNDGVDVPVGHFAEIDLARHRQLERAAVAADTMRQRTLDLRVGPGADARRLV